MTIGGGTGIPYSQQGDLVLDQVLVFDPVTQAFINATLPGGSTGEINTASNLGTGTGVYKDKIAGDLRFKSITGGSNITVSSTATDITIASSAGDGDITAGISTGTGADVYRDKDSATLRFRSISAGTNITVTQNVDDILIAASTNAATLNNIADTGFAKVTNNLSDVADVATARTNLGINSIAESDAKYVQWNTSGLPATDATVNLGDTTLRFNQIHAARFRGQADSALTALSLPGFVPGDYATIVYVDAQIANTIAAAPGALDTLNELAAALGDDPNFATTITTSLAGKESTIPAGTTAQYYRGDKSWQTLDTNIVPENTNLYYTNARADARITNAGSANWNTAFGWGDHSTGGYLTSTGVLSSHTDVHTVAPTDGQVLKWDNGNSRWAPATDAGHSSTTTLAEGTNLYYTNARADARITNAGSANWNTAFGWGDHASGGYLTSVGGLTAHTDVDAAVAGDDGKILYYDHATTSFKWKTDATGGGGGVTTLTALTDVDAAVAGDDGKILYYDHATTSFKWKTDASGGSPAGYNNTNWDTAFGWGDHGSAGYITATLTDEELQDKVGAMFSGNTETLITATYKDSDGTVDLVVNNDLANYSNASSGFLTSQTSHADVVQDGDFTSQGIMLRGAGAGSYSILTDASANWNTAYTHSQAAHAPAGAITDITNEEFTALSDVDATVAGDDGKILYYDHASTSFKWKTDTGGTPAGYNNTNWDTAFGWGDHASGGYLTSIAVNSINDTHIDWGTGANQVSTADIPEQTNLYYTDARADARAQLKIDAIIDSAPGALDTLNELAASIGDDANFAGTMTSALGGKEPTITAGTTAQYYKGNKSWATLDTAAVAENTNLYYTDARADARITTAGSANWNTAFGWGDHASGGYLTGTGVLSSHTDVHTAAPTDGQVLKWDNGNSRWAPATDSGGIALTDLSVTTSAPLGAGALTYNSGTGVFNITMPDLTPAANSIDDTHIDWGTGANQVSTADIPEQTNLYYTDARADARIGAAALSALSNVHTAAPTDGQVLKWDNGNSRWAPATDSGGIALTDLSVTTSAPLGAGALTYNSGTGVFNITMPDLSSYLTGTGAITSHTDVHTTAPTDGQILAWDNSNSRYRPITASGTGTVTSIIAGQGLTGGTITASGTIAVDVGTAANKIVQLDGSAKLPAVDGSQLTNLPSGIALTDLSVTTSAPLGAGALTYNNGTGVFNITMPDLTVAANSINDTHIDWGTGANQVSTADVPEQTNLYYTDARADARITNAGSANWNTAFGWGDHASGGYLTSVGGLTSHTDVDAVAGAGDDGKILYYDHASTSFKWKTDATGGGGGDIFKTLAVAGQSDVVADSATDTLTLVAGSNMTITTNATTDTITFAAAGGGGGGSSSYTFTVNYAAGGTSIQSITNLPAGWSSSINGSNVTITHTASGQPMGISFYGLDKSASPDTWKYGYPTSTYPVTFPDTGAGEVISTTEFTLNVGTSATGANTGTPFATSLAHIKVVF